MRLENFPERFKSKVIVDVNDCWIWTGAKDKDGYGRFQSRTRHTVYAHKFAKEFAEGVKTPEGKQNSHLCHQSSCVNPSHIVWETLKENWDRGRSIDFVRRTHCRSGLHELTQDNIHIDTYGRNQCRKCLHLRNKAAKERAKQ